MEGLFSKVNKGIYNPIPSKYSLELSSLVKYLLQTKAESWPDTDGILNFAPVKNKIDMFFNETFMTSADSMLIKTIKYK